MRLRLDALLGGLACRLVHRWRHWEETWVDVPGEGLVLWRWSCGRCGRGHAGPA